MRREEAYFDESVPIQADIGRRHPMVVFGDHRLCAGRELAVKAMPWPHMHSQVEINFVLSGEMHYWFDRRQVRVETGRLVMFWGMVPHQVTHAPEGTRFACFYLPISDVLGLANACRLREAVLRGGMICADDVQPWEGDVFLRWRRELASGEEPLEALVRDEMLARLRRLDREGWRDLCPGATPSRADGAQDAERLAPIEKMTRFVGEHGLGDIDVEAVAKAAGLHPNYAMALYKRAFGMTIKQAITRHRLDAAQSMLISTDRSIANIAFDCGFGSLSSFYEAFEKRFSISPASFRKALLGRGNIQASTAA